MAATESAPLDEGTTAAASVDSLLGAEVHWPPSRGDWLHRQRLLDRLATVWDYPVTLVAAAPGYGKTTVLAQWLESERPRAAWLSLDPGDNDPNRLWSHVAAALQRAGCHCDPGGPAQRGRDSGGPSTLRSAIVDALAACNEDIVLVLDDFQVITEAACHAQVEFVIAHLPAHAHLVIVTRADPGLRLGRLRAAGGLLEMRAGELAFTAAEADELLRRERLDLDADSIHLLMKHTEGWPAGFNLALLSLADRRDPDAFVRELSSGNRYIGDYLMEEVLSRHSDQMRKFITTVSILDRFSADLCDHVTGRTGSGPILRELERTNLFLVPLGDDGRWYRFHHLLAAVARSELALQSPRRLPSLHTRAAQWFSDRGHVDEAVRHSIAAGDTEFASRQVTTHWLQFVDAGRSATVLSWLQAVGPPNEATDPAARVTMAWLAALTGDEAGLNLQLAALEQFRGHGPLPDGSRSVDSAIAMITALFGYGGPAEMMKGAERAVALEVDRHSPFYSLAQVTLGHAAYVVGDLERALTPLANAWRNDRAPVVVRVLALATESLVHDERGDTSRARECAESALEHLETHGLRAIPQASLALTAHGRALAAAGSLDQALATLGHGLAVRRQTSAHGPWGMIHHLLIHARVAAEAGQPELARDLLGDLDSRLGRFTDGLHATSTRAAVTRRLLQGHVADTAFGGALTGREMEVLRYLQGRSSLPEIAAALYLSTNTVKTHASAVYRKLGVHTRSEAVVAARQRGLV